jgi:hypothetical protein
LKTEKDVLKLILMVTVVFVINLAINTARPVADVPVTGSCMGPFFLMVPNLSKENQSV